MGSYDMDGLYYVPESLELSKPEVTIAENGVIDISWERIEGVGGYRIFRCTQDSDDWIQVNNENLPSESTSFRDITAQAGVAYSYQVKAFIKMRSKEYNLKNYSDWITTDKSLYDTSMPEIIYLEQTYDRVHIVWNAVSGSSYYEIYRRAKANDGSWSEWKSIQSSVSGTDYMDVPPTAGTYEYLVRSVFKHKGFNFYGQFDKTEGYGVNFSPVSN